MEGLQIGMNRIQTFQLQFVIFSLDIVPTMSSNRCIVSMRRGKKLQKVLGGSQTGFRAQNTLLPKCTTSRSQTPKHIVPWK